MAANARELGPNSRRVWRWAVAGVAAASIATCAREAPPISASAEESATLPVEIQLATLSRLSAIGYSGATGGPRTEGGVARHGRQGTWAGLNLWVSGHAPVAFLMDMEGRKLHRWSLGRRRAPFMKPRRPYCSRAKALPNGDLICLFDGASLVRLDWSSELVWAYFGTPHHDFELLPTGETLVLTFAEHARPGSPAVDDEILTWVTPGGEESRRLSMIDCFDRSRSKGVWEGADPHEEGLRATGVTPLAGALSASLPGFNAGSILVSFDRPSALAVIDPDAGRVTWLRRLSSPRRVAEVLPDSLLVLDPGDERSGSSLLELDPESWEPVWEYRGSADEVLLSTRRGSAQRLPNGNTLITEADRGQVLEVNRRGRLLWRYINPHGMGPAGGYRASIFKMERLAADYFELDGAKRR